jgi:hypothetical protein
MKNKKVVVFGLGVAAVVIGVVVVNNKSNVETSNVEGVGVVQRGSDRDQGAVVNGGEFGPQEAQQVWDATQSDLLEMGLSDDLMTLLGLTEKPASYKDRNKVLRSIYSNNNLSADEVLAIRSFLDFPLSDFANMRPIEANALKNDALAILLEQETLPEGLGLQMVDMFNNADHDEVWRDYCVQFMAPFYETQSKVQGLKVEGAGDEESVDELIVVREAMFQALDARDETIAGTALIGLEDLSRDYDEFDRDVIVEKSIEIASDESASASCRLTALRLGALVNEKSQLETQNSELKTGNLELSLAETARMLAQTGETVLLQCAAITTLGDFGADEDRELLESLAQSSDRQIASAAQAALGRM